MAASLALLAVAGTFLSGPGAREVTVSPADDAYHFGSWADGEHDGLYTEWWYFNFFDARDDLQAIFSYFVTDPQDLLGHSQVQLVAVAFTGQGPVTAIDLYPLDSFTAGDEQADVAIDGSSVRVIDEHTYRITGSSRDGRLSWDLTYAQTARPWLAADALQVGGLAWEKMSWLIYMPRAMVTGRMVVDGRSFDVKAPGYHDHNWGEWVPTDGLWNWAQYSSRKIAFEMGDFIGKPAGVASVDFGGERTVFTKDQYTLRHTRWGWDADNRVLYPVESVVTAQSEARRLEMTIRVLRTAPLRGDLPLPLRDLIIYEQTARYAGRLWERNAQGDWVLAAVIKGDGFKEYTAKHY